MCNGDETQKLWKPLLTQFSLSEAHRNGLHNGLHPYIFLNLLHYLPLADRPRRKRKPLSGKPPDKDFLNSLYFFRMTTFLLQCDQSICNICNSAVSIFCDQEIIFLTDSADSRNVNSRFDRMNHSRLKGHFTAGTDIRLFMNIQSEVVSRTMWNTSSTTFTMISLSSPITIPGFRLF